MGDITQGDANVAFSAHGAPGSEAATGHIDNNIQGFTFYHGA